MARYPARFGINLNHIAEWVPHRLFLDAMKQVKAWTGTPTLDSNGWPTAGWPVTSNCFNFLNSGAYPTGTYTVYFDGTGTITIAGDGSATITTSGSTFSVSTATTTGFSVTITSSSADPSHVRNIRIALPGHSGDYDTEVFDPDFKTFIGGCGEVLRFMDPMGTNNSKQIDWADRPTTAYYTQTSSSSAQLTGTARGMAIEHIVKLCNDTGKDPWINVPHRATDDYVTELADYLAANLNSTRRVYLEYSNEIWNSLFDRAPGEGSPSDAGQYTYCKNAGAALSLGATDFQNRHRFQKRRAIEIFDLFETAFGGRTRIVHVMCGQSGSNGVIDEVMNFESSDNHKVDAIGIAPYFGGKIGSSTANPSDRKPTTLDHFFTDLHLQLDSDYPTLASSIASLISTHQKPIFTYEGGGAFVIGTSGGWAADVTLNELFNLAQHDRRMLDAYDRWLQLLGSYGIELVMHYGDSYEPGTTSTAGRWGIQETMADTTATAPKMKAWLHAASRGSSKQLKMFKH